MAGSTRLGNINQKSEKCEIGWTWYGTQFQGTGLNKATKYELLTFGFETLGFRRIQLSADLKIFAHRKPLKNLVLNEKAFLETIILMPMGSVKMMCYSIIKKEWPRLKSTVFSEFI